MSYNLGYGSVEYGREDGIGKDLRDSCPSVVLNQDHPQINDFVIELNFQHQGP